MGKLRLNWPVLGEGILSVFSILEALILFVCSQSHNIWLQYTVYIMFGVIYHTIITVARFVALIPTIFIMLTCIAL